MKITWKVVGLLVVGWALAACAGAKKPPAADLSPQTPPKLPPGVEGGPTDVNKEQLATQKIAIERKLAKKDEFSLTLIADASVAQIDAIQVDVISTDAKNATRLVADGPVKYRDSRITTGAVKNHTFRKGGTVEIKVPSITPADSIVLWAELAAPAKGSDARMLEFPLTLDNSDPVKGAVANPITFKLTANGWQREN
jgi:hypothetical protein